MSATSESEKDITLKLRTMRYLWNLGYFVRKNVAIIESQESGKQYTDIDVLATKVDDELDAEFMICDCKSGVQAKTRERLFWISGVMKFFGATQALFIRTKLFGGKYLELNKQLGIMPLSEDQLTELEKSYGIKNDWWYGPFAKEQIDADKIFAVLREFSPETSDYLKSLYWQDSPPEQIATIIACCNRIKGLEQIDISAKHFLLTYALSFLTLSIIRFAKNVLPVPDAAKGETIEIELLGGRLEQEERKKLLRGFYDFMVKEIQERYKARYPITSSQFLESLIPLYSKHLIDLVIRLCRNPRNYVLLPRLFDTIAYETILGHRDLRVQDIVPSSFYFDASTLAKPMKDFLVFAERSDFLTPSLLEFLNTKIGTIA